MTHGLETMKRLNDEASLPKVAEVRHVMDANNCEALYIDGVLVGTEDAWVISVGVLASHLKGRLCRIVRIDLSDDFDRDVFPANYGELVPYIDMER
jgi:hypothetical protein